MNNSNSLISSLVKKAQQPTPNEVTRALALRDIANMGLAGFGVGAGARGLYGLFNLVNRRRGPEEVRPVGRIETGFPVEEEEEKIAGAPPVEMLPSESGVLAPSLPHATPTAPPMGPPAVEGGDIPAEGGDAPLAVAKQAGYFADLLKGEKSQSKTGIPYYLAGTVGAGAGGAYGGWKLMDMLLDRRRMQAQEDDLEKAREDFQQALVSRHSRGKKASADNTLGEDLDLLFDTLSVKCAALEKKAQEGTPTGNALGTVLDYYGLYAGGTGLLGGVLMYNAAKKRQRRALLEKAKEERERQRFEKQPPRIEFSSFAPPKAPTGAL